MRSKAIEAQAKWRLALVGVIVSVGAVAITPSFAFDSDRDGVVDSVEIYELGTDPSSADTLIVDKEHKG